MDIEALAIDANIIVSAMIGGGTRDLLLRLALRPLDLQAPDDVFNEVQDHLVDLAGYVHARIDAFRLALASVPIRRVKRAEYDHELERAAALVKARDPRDAPIVALALARGIPVWSNDKDLKAVRAIRVLTTREVASLFP